MNARSDDPETRLRVARGSAATAQDLIELVTAGLDRIDKGGVEIDVLREVACRPDSPAAALDPLARLPEFRADVAANGATPGYVLHRIVTEYDDGGRGDWAGELSVACHANSRGDTLAYLADTILRDYSDSELERIIPATDAAEGFFGPDQVLVALAAHPATPAAVADEIIRRLHQAFKSLPRDDRAYALADARHVLSLHAVGGDNSLIARLTSQDG